MFARKKIAYHARCNIINTFLWGAVHNSLLALNAVYTLRYKRYKGQVQLTLMCAGNFCWSIGPRGFGNLYLKGAILNSN